jgi:hypothetical protein
MLTQSFPLPTAAGAYSLAGTAAALLAVVGLDDCFAVLTRAGASLVTLARAGGLITSMELVGALLAEVED